jgi:hypothetical protein
VQEQHQTRDVYGGLSNSLEMRAQQSLSHEYDAEKPETEIENGYRGKEIRRLYRQPARAPQGIQAEQNQRHQDPI